MSSCVSVCFRCFAYLSVSVCCVSVTLPAGLFAYFYVSVRQYLCVRFSVSVNVWSMLFSGFSVNTQALSLCQSEYLSLSLSACLYLCISLSVCVYQCGVPFVFLPVRVCVSV